MVETADIPLRWPWQRPTFTERASTLILVPTMMLVFIALGSIAVDLSALHLAHRRTHNVVSAAADDAAGMLDGRALQIDGAIRIDGDAATRLVTAKLALARLPGQVVGEPMILVGEDGRTLTVALTLRVEHIFLKSFPGFDAEVIDVQATATLND